MTANELPESGTANILENHDQPTSRKPRRWVFGAVGTFVMAGVAVGATYAAGLWDSDGGLKQVLCGQRRADDTPFGLLLPKGRPGVEQRNVTQDALDGRPLRICTISVDGHEAVRVLVSNIHPDQPPAGVTSDPKEFIAQGGVGASAAGALVMEYCPNTRSLAAVASVSLDSALRPQPSADQEAAKRALTQLARAILAEQRHEVC